MALESRARLSDDDLRAAIDGLRGLLDAVERGDIAEGGPRSVALRRRIEGAVIALETLHDNNDEDV